MLRCLITTIGGDAPGLNAAVRAVARLALKRDLDVYGSKQGWLGLIKSQFWKLREVDVGNILGRGGSVLGSTDFKIEPNDFENQQAIAESLKKFDLVVAVGGLGSFAVLHRIYDTFDMGLTTTMFIPASIEGEFLDPTSDENSVHGHSIGTDTAANTAVSAVDRLRDQSFHSKTVFLVECVGLKSNYLPIQVGLASGAHRIYLPPFPRLNAEAKSEIQELYGSDFDPNYVDVRELVSWMSRMFEDPNRKYLLVVMPHGVPLVRVGSMPVEDEKYENLITAMNPLELTVLRVAEALGVHFSEQNAVQVRYVLLDDLQKGGAPSVRDRLLGSLYGEAAVEEFLSVMNGADNDQRGNLNLLTINDTTRVGWTCHPRQAVTHLFQGKSPRAGGLDPLPFFRQARGTVSGYRPLATL